MPPSSTRFLALILTCALVACGDRVPSGSITNLDGGIPSTPDDGADGSTLLSSISGIKVTSSPENEHTARATLGKFGGSVAATGSDGTRYELRVPPLALAMATQIAITPLHIDGPESIASAVEHAVRFEPSGLVFAEPALLTITPAQVDGAKMPSALAASFGDGPGLELLAARASRSGASLIEVAHFSGVMTLSAHLAAYRALVALVIADYTAVQNDAQLSADVQRLLATVGNPQATPSQLAQDRQTVANDLQRLVDAVLQPAADKAVDGLLAFFASERLYLDFEARRVLLLAHDPDLGDVVGLHADVLAARTLSPPSQRRFSRSSRHRPMRSMFAMTGWRAIPRVVGRGDLVGRLGREGTGPLR